MAKWTVKDIPNQQGKIIVITGANSGLGFEMTKALASRGAHVIMACRSKMNAHKAYTKIKEENPDAFLDIKILDLSSFESIGEFAKDHIKNFPRLDTLINNAGVMLTPYSKTSNGLELQMGVNHFGHFMLTMWLLPALQAAGGSRIVNVSSNAHHRGDIDFTDINWKERRYNRSQAYNDSKLANLYFTYELHKRMDGKNPKVVSAHPGFAATNLLGHNKYLTMNIPLLAQSAAMGALPILFAASDHEVEGGDYFGPDGYKEIKGYPAKVTSSPLSHDRDNQRRLWEISEKYYTSFYTQ